MWRLLALGPHESRQGAAGATYWTAPHIASGSRTRTHVYAHATLRPRADKRTRPKYPLRQTSCRLENLDSKFRGNDEISLFQGIC